LFSSITQFDLKHPFTLRDLREMSNPKTIYIKDITENQQIDSLFLVKDMRLAETKSGNAFLTLNLMDNSGEIVGRVWNNAQRYAEVCQPGNVVRLSGQCESYRSVLQLNISSATVLDPSSYSLADFMPASPYDVKAMENELLAKIDSLEDVYIKQLLQAFVDDPALWQLFKMAPAAKSMHHAYIGGLLEHTLGLLRLAESVASHYPAINRSLLFAGVFLHDYGKIKEFSFERPPVNYSDYGRLVGHMVITIELLHDKINQIQGFPEQTAMMIKHLVLSHHGRYEFGSAVLPMIREAFVLHLIDDLDAKMNFLDRLSSRQEGDDYQWTDYQRTLERFLYVHGPSDEFTDSDTGADSSSPDGTSQQSVRKTQSSADASESETSRQIPLWEE